MKIAILPGDGIGPEVISEAVKVLDIVADKFNLKLEYKYADVGGIAIDNHGEALPKSTINTCKNSDAILLGAIGGPKWDNLPREQRPERAALLRIRKLFDLYANLRPVVLFKELKDSCPVKNVEELDIMIVRELTSGIYFGKKQQGKDWASDEMRYTTKEIQRIAKVAFDIARKRKKKVCSVDKANALTVMNHWRNVIVAFAKKNQDIKLTNMYVDNAAMQLVINPKQFDVILTENMFGDILSDEASVLAGSLGMLPSASINGKFGLYEPAGGSAPDIAGKNIANPIAAILSVALMLRYSFNLEKEAKAIENAVRKTLKQGYRTKDIMQKGYKLVGTKEMGNAIVNNL